MREIPGPTAWPIVGCIPDFMSRSSGVNPPNGPQMNRAHEDYYKKFGSIYRLQMPGDTHVTICRPEEYMKMYRNEGNYPTGGAETLWIVKRWADENAKETYIDFLGRGEPWRHVRHIVQEELIAPKKARSYLPFINEAARLASPSFADHAGGVDKFVTRLAFDMFASLFYGIQLKTATPSASAKDLEFVENTSKVFTLLGTSVFSGYLKLGIFRNHPLNKEFIERWNRSYAYSEELMDRAVGAAKDMPPDIKPYIVRILESGKMSPEAIKEVAANTMLAGIDTTQSVMNWNLLYLALNPDKQDKLRDQLREVLRDGPMTEEVAASMNKQLPYLRAVVRETHRVAPPSPIMTMRDAPCDLVLNGFNVPKGTKVGFNIYSIQNDPKYVEKPEAFEPERWLPEAVGARKGTEAEVIDDKLLATPFSFGARMCLGGRVADLETYVMLAQLIRDWRISTLEEAPTWKVLQPLMTKAMPFPKLKIEKC